MITPQRVLAGKVVFLSASIPSRRPWADNFDALEITDAVVAVGRSILSAGATLVTAAHPTIAPLLLYVAAEVSSAERPAVSVYQSEVFASIMPEETRRFEAEGVGIVVRTQAVEGEPPNAQFAPRSLELMRRRLLEETQPVAAVFIGGMDGIPREHDLFTELRPGFPTYALGRPGGAARALAEDSPSRLKELLTHGDVYPSIGRAIVEDIRGVTS